MTACLNGRFVPESEASVPISDRSFLYGDGVFETLRVYRGVPFAWDRHMDRMRAGAFLLGIPLPAEQTLRHQAEELVRRNGALDCVLRIHVSRGSGPRGYAPGHAGPPLCLMTTGEVPDLDPAGPRQVALVTSRWRLPSGAGWADCKSANRLIQVMASADAIRVGADEALLFNEREEVVEAASANFFWVTEGVVSTPALDCGALAGVTREWVLKLAADLGYVVREHVLPRDVLAQVEAAFLTSSVLEIQRLKSLDGRMLEDAPEIGALHRAYRERVGRNVECRT